MSDERQVRLTIGPAERAAGVVYVHLLQLPDDAHDLEIGDRVWLIDPDAGLAWYADVTDFEQGRWRLYFGEGEPTRLSPADEGPDVPPFDDGPPVRVTMELQARGDARSEAWRRLRALPPRPEVDDE